MFTFIDILDETRHLLNDTITPYRYSNAWLGQICKRGITDIHRRRPDARINNSGTGFYSTTDLFEYTASSYMDDYSRIDGWDRVNDNILYFGAISASSVRVYPTGADRTADTNHVAVIDGTDEYGLKRVGSANDSGYGGIVNVLSAIPDTTTWDVEVNVLELPLDDIFMLPLVYYIVSRCYDIDSEDTGDNNLASKYQTMYSNEVLAI